MKLIIQIPCLNEEMTLPLTLAALPRQIAGIDAVEFLVIDDGSSDGTAAVAAACGVDHIVRLPVNMGLATAFLSGIRQALDCGADIIVNTDADNQYVAADIPRLLAPILAGRTGFVIGCRPVAEIEIPLVIKLLHKVGSVMVTKASGIAISDPPSGFRAFSREVAGQLQVHNNYTYTLETIIQAGNRGINIETVDIRINSEKLRPSRLMSSPYSYVAKSAVIIMRSLLYYNRQRFVRLLCLPLILLMACSLLLFHFHGRNYFFLLTFIVSIVVILLLLGITLPVICRRGDYARPDAHRGQ